MSIIRHRMLPICLVPLLLVTPARGTDLFVAPNGDDAQQGTVDQPFATPARALVMARAVRDEPVTIHLRGGTYELDAPLTLAFDDTRTEAAPLTLRAYQDERPILSAGVQLRGWQVGDDGRWRLTLPQVKDGMWQFGQLFVADQRRLRPRVPDSGYFHIASNLPPTEANAKRGFDRFQFDPGDIHSDWSNLHDVEVFAIHRWASSRMRIASVDTQQQIVNFTGPTRGLAAWCDFEKGHRYFADNVKEALSKPGQWHLDRPTGVLTYIPLPGETPDVTPVVAPRIEMLLVLIGNVKEHRWIEHVRFEGLTFAHTNWSCPQQGDSFPQAAVHAGETVAAVAARHVSFKRCAIVHSGGYAIGFGAGCRNVLVEACEMVDLGAGGVKIGIDLAAQSCGNQAVDRDDPESAVEHVTVRDCTIAHAGRIHPAGVGIWIGHASYNLIEHNDIHDLYYSGISVGWTWGYDTPSQAHDNEIAWNDVHQIGQGVLSDMGGIYTLGVSPGTRIHHNSFHDINSFSYGGWGLYTDEGSSEIAMDHNLVYNTKDGSFHQHYGRDNQITHNILINSQLWQVRRSRVEDHRSFNFAHNIVCWTLDTPLLGSKKSNWEDGRFDMDDNLYWHDGRPFDFAGITLDQWQAMGKDTRSVIADPMFVDVPGEDFHLREDSPAASIGFEPWDYTKAGRLTAPTLTRAMPPVPATFH
ncbi:MAG: right-handed parallel beta-helix repeat-containing protein [Phycisphaeraceae bacterium]|nr:right-handed parallel beta-helix repeat-containing protein [Phycisphaeraceae bacterium]